MKHEFPTVDHLAAVTKMHAENYTYSLLYYGKFEQSKVGCKRERKPLSNTTVTDYLTTISEVFSLLADDAGIVVNPFAQIPKPTMDKEPRQPFTESELQTIRENFDPFIEPFFVIAMATALREGDICTLKWAEVDFENRVIRRSKMRKTGKGVDIPIMPHLYQYLQALYQHRNNQSQYAEYVLPEHADMYLHNRSGIPYRIKKFLKEKCGIVTTEKRPDRTRAASIKDLHSCRHTFCYYVGLNGVPLNVVQSIVGHMTPEMTKHYSDHASLEVKREKMQLLPDFMQMTVDSESLGNCSQDTEIQHLLQRIPRKYSPELRQLLDFIANNDVRAIIELRRALVS
jgi:integrase